MTSEDIKGGVHHETQVEKPSKKQTCMRHCKRFWWIYAILLIIGAVLVVVIAIFVVVPKVAQSKINEAELEIQGVNVLQTKTDSYLMEINSTITTDGAIQATVDGFKGDMYLEDLEPHAVFASLDFPQTNANKHQTVNVSQEITITDKAAFDNFNIWFANNETLRITIKGNTQVQPKGLNRKSGVTFKKTLTVNGLNLFKGTKVTGGHISVDSDVPYNFNGTAEIPNASDFTLDIGNATFDNFVEDQKVGTLVIENLLLRPGVNKVDIKANLDQIAIITLASSDKYCKTGVIPFKLLGTDVKNHGQELPYFAAALASANQTVPMDIGAIIKADLGTTISCSS